MPNFNFLSLQKETSGCLKLLMINFPIVFQKKKSIEVQIHLPLIVQKPKTGLPI